MAEIDTPPMVVLLAYIAHLPSSPSTCMWTTNHGLRSRCSRRRWWSLVSPSLPSVNSVVNCPLGHGPLLTPPGHVAKVSNQVTDYRIRPSSTAASSCSHSQCLCIRPIATHPIAVVKVKVNVDCIAPRREHTSKALRYGTRSQGISQFYLHTPCTSANRMNHTCLCLPSRSWYSFTDPGGMEG